MARDTRRLSGRIARSVGRVLHVLAWLVVIAALALFALEESGVLVDLVRDRIAERLGSVGERLRLERVSLRWFEPGLVLEGLVLEAPGGVGGKGAKELVRLKSVHVSIEPFSETSLPLELVEIEGGRILLCPELVSDVQTLAALADPRTGGPVEAPEMVVTELEIALEEADGGALDLGRAALLARPSESGALELRGGILPSLGGAVGSGTLRLAGQIEEGFIRLRTSSRSVPFRLAESGSSRSALALPMAELAGELTLDSSVEIGAGSVQGSLRASIAKMHVIVLAGDPPLEEGSLELDARLTSASELDLFAREAWHVVVRGSGRWLDSPVEAWALAGRAAPEGELARVFGRIERLPLEEHVLSALHAAEVRGVREAHAAFQPSGTVDASFAAVWDGPVGKDRRPSAWPVRGAALLRARGAAAMTFQGWIDADTSERIGVPVPCRRIEGDVPITWDGGLERAWRVALARLHADHGSGLIAGTGLINAPPGASTRPFPELDLLIDSSSMAIDATLLAGLAGNQGTRDIERDYQPLGGTLAGRWHLHDGEDTQGFTASGAVEVRDASLAWAELPVPFQSVSGRLTFLWSGKKTRISDAKEPHSGWRAFGIAYELDNLDPELELAPGDVRARVVGFARQEDALEASLGLDAIDQRGTSGIDVQIEDLNLKGEHWKTLLERVPQLAAFLEENVELAGFLRGTYHGSNAARGAPYVAHIEAMPANIEAVPKPLRLTPKQFQRAIENVRGRVLVLTEQKEGAPDAAVSAATAFAGLTGDDTLLAFDAAMPADGTGEARVFIAGLDPANAAVQGAVLKSLTGAGKDVGEGLQQRETAFRGRFDAELEMRFDPLALRPADKEFRFFLRGNALAFDTLELTDLAGVLEHRQGILTSPHALAARLAGHPLEISGLQGFELGLHGSVPGADPLLDEPGAYSDPSGFALQMNVTTEALPLDVEHLSSLFSDAALEPIRESRTWHGTLDVEGARLLLTYEKDGAGKLLLVGALEVHDTALRLGLPLRVESARLDVEELVLEAGRLRGWGRISDLDADLAGRALSGAGMLVGYVDGRLTIDNLSGDFAGGRLESLGGASGGSRKALGIDLDEPHGFDLGLSMRGAAAEELLLGVFESSIADRGSIDFGLLLRGNPDEVLGLAGSGWLNVDQGELASVPVMRVLFAQLGFEEGAIFDRLQAQFQVRDGVVIVTDVKLRSRLLNLVGSGRLDLDGSLAFDLQVRYALLDRLGPISRIVYWLNKSLWSVSVRGTMSRPIVRVESSLFEFLRRSRDRRGPLLPLPPFAPLEPRF